MFQTYNSRTLKRDHSSSSMLMPFHQAVNSWSYEVSNSMFLVKWLTQEQIVESSRTASVKRLIRACLTEDKLGHKHTTTKHSGVPKLRRNTEAMRVD